MTNRDVQIYPPRIVARISELRRLYPARPIEEVVIDAMRADYREHHKIGPKLDNRAERRRIQKAVRKAQG